jgi:hypothetical protein
MWLGVQLACFLLKLPLTLQQRTKLVGAILESNNAVPLKEVITFAHDGSMIIEDERIDFEKAIQIRESARAALDNTARKYVQNQVAAVAGRRGVAEGDTPEKLYFYRAALWWGGMEQELYEKLAQRS